MLIIRRAQMHVLARHTADRFEGRAMIHVRQCFPERSNALGEDGLLSLIREGIGRAQSYGIEIERDVVKYIDLMVVFGEKFDTDPNHPEANRILTHKRLSARSKMGKLYAYFNDVPEEPAAAP